MERHIEEIKKFIKRSVKELNKDGVVIGISGGVDSAVCTALAVLSLGNKKVFGLILPERETAPESIRYAKKIAEMFGIEYKIVDITSVLRKVGIYKLVPPGFFPYSIKKKYTLKRFKKLKDKYKNIYIAFQKEKGEELNKIRAYTRAKNRVRMIYLYFYADLLNFAVLGTLNKVEVALGFYVRHGDGASDIMPIAHLLKSEVVKIAEYLKIPSEIIQRSPSPDLAPGLGDEDIMGFSYDEIERMLKSNDKRIINFVEIGKRLLSLPLKLRTGV